MFNFQPSISTLTHQPSRDKDIYFILQSTLLGRWPFPLHLTSPHLTAPPSRLPYPVDPPHLLESTLHRTLGTLQYRRFRLCQYSSFPLCNLPTYFPSPPSIPPRPLPVFPFSSSSQYFSPLFLQTPSSSQGCPRLLLPTFCLLSKVPQLNSVPKLPQARDFNTRLPRLKIAS